jgi:two-component system nitrogen regulation response regulator GlnG
MSPTQNVQPVDLPNEIIQAEPYENTITSSWEDGFSLWLKNLIENNESGLLDTINPKIEKMLIKLVLEKTNGKKNDAANILGLGRNTLAKKIKELGI